MLANIDADSASIVRERLMIDQHLAHELRAMGRIRIDASSPMVEARLWMRSLVRDAFPGQAKGPKTTIEIIAVGPAQELLDDDARQFIESLRFAQ